MFCKSDGSPLQPDLLRREVLYPTLDRRHIPRSLRSAGLHTFWHSAGSFVNAETGNLKLAQKAPGPLEPEHYGGHLQAHLRRSRTRRRRCRRKGDLRGFVPNCSQNREQEQPNGHVVRKETSDGSTRNQKHESRLAGSPLSGYWLRGPATIRTYPQFPSLLRSSQITSDTAREAECVDNPRCRVSALDLSQGSVSFSRTLNPLTASASASNSDCASVATASSLARSVIADFASSIRFLSLARSVSTIATL